MKRIVGFALVAVCLTTTGCGGGGDKTKTTNARGYSTEGAALAKSDYAAKIKGYLDQYQKIGTDLSAVTPTSKKSDIRDIANRARTVANGVSALNPPTEFQADNAAFAKTLRAVAGGVDSAADAGNDKAKLSQISSKLGPAIQTFTPVLTDFKTKLGI